MIFENYNSKSCIMKKSKFLYNILAWGPAFIVISSLISIFFILPFTFLPSKKIELTVNDICIQLPIVYLVEVIMLILMTVYGLRLYSAIKNAKVVTLYSLLVFISVLIFLCFQKPVILLQPILPLVFSIIFDERLFKIKNFLNTSKLMLAYLNIFDIFYILALQWTFTIKGLPEWLGWLVIIFILFVFPIPRTSLLYFYTKQVKIDGDHDITYFSSYVIMFIMSFVQLSLYSIMFLTYLKSEEKSIINLVAVNMVLATLSIYFWALLKTQLDKGGNKKKDELVGWGFGILTVLLIFFYDRIEGEFLVILSWLLPVLISTIVGELHYQFVTDGCQEVPVPTVKMKKHVYLLQLISFLMLFCLNLFSALFTIKKIEGDEIISLNTGKDSLIKLLNLISNGNQEPVPEVLSSLTSSFIIVSLSFILALILSAGGLKLLKINYKDSSKGYYDFRNSIPNTSKNRKYRKNIHKRRKTNV